jgi:toxin ParE1/3/4
MNRWNLTRHAKASLIEIYEHTLTKWGTRQADAYLEKIYSRLSKIADKTVAWRAIPKEFEVDGYFTRCERHYIYWRQTRSGEIIIADILHVSMMQGDRLNKAFGSPEEK